MRISTRLAVNAVAVLTLTTLVGIVGATCAHRIAGGLGTISDLWLPSVRYSSAIRSDILDYRNRETQLLIAEGNAEIDETVGRMGKNLQDLEKHESAFLALISDPALQALFNDYHAKLAVYQDAHKQLETLVRGGKTSDAIIFFRTKSRAAFRDLLPNIDKMVDFSVTRSDEARGVADAINHSARRWMLFMVVLALMLGTSSAWWLAQSIRKPLRRIHDAVIEIERHSDFTHQIGMNTSDELGETAQSVDALIGKVRETLKHLSEGIGHVSRAAEELATSAGHVSDASNRQSDSAATMAASVEELSASIDQVTDSAQSAHRLSVEAGEVAERGGKVICEAIVHMNEVASQSEATSESIQQLGTSFKEITGIVQVIGEVAEQTNLLALNATIEAARAGEQGRGFAVVADEVRKLAERTANSSASIGRKIEAIQSRVEQAIARMQTVEELATQGVQAAATAEESVQTIVNGSVQVKSQVTAISDALREQDIASRQIAEHVERIAMISETNSQDAATTAALSKQLAQLAVNMQTAAAAFRV